MGLVDPMGGGDRCNGLRRSRGLQRARGLPEDTPPLELGEGQMSLCGPVGALFDLGVSRSRRRAR